MALLTILSGWWQRLTSPPHPPSPPPWNGRDVNSVEALEMTITGTIENALGMPLHVAITFRSKSTPIVGSGVVVGNTTKRIKSNPVDGSFSINLLAGNYDVVYFTSPDRTQFSISVPDGGGTMGIDEVATTPLSFVFTAPNTVWNGQRAGHITFLPIDNPLPPTAQEVAYTGGHITNETYRYSITYLTADGETAVSNQTPIVGSGASNKAIRITTPTGVPNVTSKRIWRNIASGSTNVFLLATIAPSQATYDDFESHADFSARHTTTPITSLLNTTAGIIYGKPGFQTMLATSDGIRFLANCSFLQYFVLGGEINQNGDGWGFAMLGGDTGFTGGTGGTISIVGGEGGLGNSTTGGNVIIEGGDADTKGIVKFPNSFQVPLNAVNGYVLTSDNDGNATWQPGGGGGGGTTEVYYVTADPNGTQTATRPAVAYNNSGGLWVKTNTGTNNTGWLQLLG